MIKMENDCNLCNKDKKNFEGLIYYYGEKETYLCKSCYMRWCKNEKYKLLKLKYKDTKPCTKTWENMCRAEQKEFNKWMKTQYD